MSRELASLAAREMGLSPGVESLLVKNIKSLSRDERKLYFEKIKPLEHEIKILITGYYSGSSDGKNNEVIKITVDSLLEKKGDPDLIDSMAMDVIGRIKVYNFLRERSENEGIKLNAMTSFGGLSMVLFAVVIITAIVLYFLS
ncbi:MAG: hypothetical protein ACOY46_10415 [Bacillota bacterium]